MSSLRPPYEDMTLFPGPRPRPVDDQDRVWDMHNKVGRVCLVLERSRPTGGFFLAPAEECSLGLHQKGPSGPKVILLDGQTAGQPAVRPDRRLDRWPDGRTVRRTDSQTDGQTTDLRELDLDFLHRTLHWCSFPKIWLHPPYFWYQNGQHIRKHDRRDNRWKGFPSLST